MEDQSQKLRRNLVQQDFDCFQKLRFARELKNGSTDNTLCI